jgi:hypothetical protein
MTATQIPARLRWRGWLTQERLAELPGSRQFFIARLTGDPSGQTFTVILTFPTAGVSPGGTTDAGLELLAPDLLPDVVNDLTPGRRLTVYSGPREVAELEVLTTA